MLLFALPVLAQDASSPAQSSQPAPVRLTQKQMRQLTVVKRVNPDYSKDLRRQRVQGTVTMDVVINQNGDVSAVSPVSGPPALVRIAADAVKQWKYKPFLVNGQPVSVETEVVLNFTLAGS
jgi:TonB family protein